MNDDLSQCRNQVLRFFRYLDERQYSALTALLSPQAVWHRQGRILAGPAQVHAALMQRSPTMRIVHLISNLMADELDAQHCTMRCYMLVVRHEPGRDVSGPVPLDGIENIRTMAIRLERADTQWLITELKGEDLLFAAETGDKK